jgi:hypothetical protein
MASEILRLKDSTSIAAASYDRRRGVLQVTFKPGRAAHRGSTYDYLDVPPATVDELLRAESLGKFVNWRIKPHYEYKKVS